MGCVPVQLPGPAVSVWPLRAVPEIVGGELLTGAVDGATTDAVWFEVAVAVPTEFLAVTTTRRVLPTSPAATVYVVAVSPAMSTHVAPQRCHCRVVVIGCVPTHVPSAAVSTWLC